MIIDVIVIMWINDVYCLFLYVVIVLVFIVLFLVLLFVRVLLLFVVKVIGKNIDFEIFVSFVVCLNILWVV